MAQQYVDLVKEVEDIENGFSKVDFSTIDISLILPAKSQHEKPAFKELLDIVTSIESARQISYEQAPRQQKVQQARQVIQMQQTAKPSWTTATATQEPRPIEIKQQIQVQPTITRPSMEENVTSEIGTFADKLEQKNGPQPSQQTNSFKIEIDDDGQLVLPKLSTSDQISELERIMEGLKEHVFDEGHIEIVKKEVYGLNKAIISDRKRGVYVKQSSGLEQSLIILRDQHLSEVIAMLSGSK